ncbi:MAG: TIGR02281 family clan AA aspartic protease [Burkholderiaceae bacterium]
MRPFMRSLLDGACIATLSAACAAAGAATIDVVGLFPGKAVVTVDKGAPRSISVGDTVAGFKLVSVDGNGATFLVDGRRTTIPMGSYLAGTADHGRATAVLSVDGRGHYVAQGAINGISVRFLVDTGATLVMLPSSEADRLGLAYKRSPLEKANTANGSVPYRVVKIDRIRVGDVELTNVDAGVLDGYDGPPLLGMSFLSRTEVSRDGANMLLTRRY